MNELVTWSFNHKQPTDDEVIEKYGKNPPALGFNLGEYLKGGALLSCMVMHLNRHSYNFQLTI